MKDRYNYEKDNRNRYAETKETGKTGEYNWKIRVRTVAHLGYWLKDCFEGLDIIHEGEGTTLISGELSDLPKVYGLILQLRDSGIVLVSLQVDRVPDD